MTRCANAALQEFVAQYGNVEKSALDGRSQPHLDYGVYPSLKSLENRALAFTCGQVTTMDSASDVAIPSLTSKSPAGTLLRLVQGDVAECHSDRESMMNMACINKAVIKSYVMTNVEMNTSAYANSSDYKSEVVAAWKILTQETLKEVTSLTTKINNTSGTSLTLRLSLSLSLLRQTLALPLTITLTLTPTPTIILTLTLTDLNPKVSPEPGAVPLRTSTPRKWWLLAQKTTLSTS